MIELRAFARIWVTLNANFYFLFVGDNSGNNLNLTKTLIIQPATYEESLKRKASVLCESTPGGKVDVSAAKFMAQCGAKKLMFAQRKSLVKNSWVILRWLAESLESVTFVLNKPPNGRASVRINEKTLFVWYNKLQEVLWESLSPVLWSKMQFNQH